MAASVRMASSSLPTFASHLGLRGRKGRPAIRMTQGTHLSRVRPMHETLVRGILEKGKSHLQPPCRPERGGSIDELAAISLHRTLEQVGSIREANLR